jgi:transposase
MARYDEGNRGGKDVFVGVDLHRKFWQVTIRTAEWEGKGFTVPPRWEALRSLLEAYGPDRIKVVYEAGYFGFWLYDRIVEWGAECVVTPPSLIPREYGNRVKTDKKDSRKLADLLCRGLLKAVWVPPVEQRGHRQVLRTRRQLVRARVDAQLRIKAFLRFYGIEIPEPRGKWSRTYVENLKRFRFGDRYVGESFGRYLEGYDFLSRQIEAQTALLKELAETAPYREAVMRLRGIFGVGLLSAMEILLEIGDFTRFKRSSQIAAYVGLTPSQYSSGEKVRMGRITGIGKNALRAILVEASWKLVAQDGEMRRRYEVLKVRAGGKRAIVAVARHLIIRVRRMMLDGQPYVPGLAA